MNSRVHKTKQNTKICSYHRQCVLMVRMLRTVMLAVIKKEAFVLPQTFMRISACCTQTLNRYFFREISYIYT